jgi:2-octaprenyl-6-methoxyphenol hydroxylase
MPVQPDFDVVVAGAGPAGLAAGLSAAHLGLTTAVAGPPASRTDARSAALFEGSIRLLQRLGVWRHIADAAEPISGIRLIDATHSLFRAPEVMFKASEIGLAAFGYSILNRDLTTGLEAAAQGKLSRIGCDSVSVTAIEASRACLAASDGTALSASLVAAADGRASAARTAAGIGVRSWAYEQAAVVCNLEHTRPHDQISTEWHRASGPLTLVPAPRAGGSTYASSLVWVETPDEARQLAALDDERFTAALLSHIGGYAGSIAAITPRQVFPLSGQTAEPLAQNRVALIGEAGHVIPPIGAQGLNLSFRDAATLAELAADAKAQDRDIGGPEMLKSYDAARRQDVLSRIYTVDLLNRSLISSLPPVHLARSAGLFGLHLFGPLRRFVMREGVSPMFSTPLLMRDNTAADGLDGATRQRA